MFSTINNEDSLTQQSDAEECDINIIMKKFSGGQLPTAVGQPLYGDFSDGADYRTMVERIQNANDAFNELPADTRYFFHNDPARFMDFVQDEKNLPKLRELGLAMPEAPPPTEPEPQRVVIVNPTPEAGK